MVRKLINRGNVFGEDYLRALITDTLPAEVPIIFSNDGYYTNQHLRKNFSQSVNLLLEQILDPNLKTYTIPYRYRVTKNNISTRRLSLIHPSAQIAVVDFYRQYQDLICYYNSQSSFSIRAPNKVGSTYFFRSTISERNKYKNSSIDTLEFENRIRNPASYFSYKGHDRLFKFFDSPKFVRLEKKYSTMWFGDVSKCFDSVYTHSISWATKTMPHAKRSIGRASFGEHFDRLMQTMNYNETNGICIGPEVSRIFAETILQRVDHQVSKRALELGIQEYSQYECFRYVDDIIIFAVSDNIAAKIYSIFEGELGQFNLHLNELKLSKFRRPFQTDKSRIVHELKDHLTRLNDQISYQHPEGIKLTTLPVSIRKPSSVISRFIKDVKATCSDRGVGYDMVSNYVVASLTNLLERIIDGYGETPEDVHPKNETYFKTLELVLELAFFFYTVNPTVSMSFNLSKAVVLSIQFAKNACPERVTYLSERIAGWSFELIRALKNPSADFQQKKVPVEVINIVLAFSDTDVGKNFSPKFLSESVFKLDNIDYFSVTSFLFFAGKKAEYAALRSTLQQELIKYFAEEADVVQRSHDAHLFFDIIACPHLTVDARSRVLQSVSKKTNVPTMNLVDCRAAVKELGSKFWFVNWSRVDLLNMIRRKELSSVY